MNDIILWCNNNTGFLTAILSIIGLLLSTIAIVISLKTARLPYRKAIKLTTSYDVLFSKNMVTSDVVSQMAGISVNAANIGARNINITFLGLAIKDQSLGRKPQKLSKINEEMTGMGLLKPTEISTISYNTIDLIQCFSKVRNDAQVYAYAIDSEGTNYYKKAGKAGLIVKYLSSK